MNNIKKLILIFMVMLSLGTSANAIQRPYADNRFDVTFNIRKFCAALEINSREIEEICDSHYLLDKDMRWISAESDSIKYEYAKTAISRHLNHVKCILANKHLKYERYVDVFYATFYNRNIPQVLPDRTVKPEETMLQEYIK